MNKKFNKAVSLILALMLVFSIMPFAFAADSYTYDDLTQEEVEKIALEYLTFKNQTSYVYDTEYNYSPAYKVISTVILANNKVVTFVCYIDKYTEDVLYRTANYAGENSITSSNPLTQDEALNYAITTFGADKDDVVVLTKERVITDDGEIAYHFIFCENTFERNECTVIADNGFIDDISLSWPSNIVDRLVLMIRVFIARFNLFSLLRK
jgi:hypothetical protein